MRKVLFVLIGLLLPVVAGAACPSGWEEIPMENITITTSSGACPAGTESYYHVDTMCNANVL